MIGLSIVYIGIATLEPLVDDKKKMVLKMGYIVCDICIQPQARRLKDILKKILGLIIL